MIATKEHIQRLKIREGEEMFYMRLFSPFFGTKANIPAFQFGRLSMIPDEKVVLADGAQDVYLMQVQTFGGFSGSPVFFHLDRFRKLGGEAYLMGGVVKGYYYNQTPVKFRAAAGEPYVPENRGMALIVPGFLLHEILFSEEMKQARGNGW